MFVIENHIRVQKGHADSVLDKFRQSKGVTSSPGFVRVEVFKKVDHEEHDVVIVRTTWENEEYFTAWTNSESFHKAHQRPSKPEGESAPSVMLGNHFEKYTIDIVHLPE